jgi:hypothetical protein
LTREEFDMRRFVYATTLTVLMVAGARAADDGATIAAPLGSAITYQGKLDKNSVGVNGNCNFVFTLYNALSGGSQVGIAVSISNQPVAQGLFTVTLDFGAGAFDGQGRWLSIQVQGPGDAGFTTLAPRQPLAAAPYALYALGGPATGSQWSTGADGHDLTYINGGVGITGSSSPFPSGHGVYIEGYATYGGAFAYDYTNLAPMNLILQSPGGKVGVGVTNPDGILQANSSTSAAVIGKHTGNWVGVYGESQGHAGVWGNSVTGVAVVGTSSQTWGVSGENTTAQTKGILGSGTDGVVGIVTNAAHIGGRFENTAGGTALFANGLAKVSTLQILGGADIVESFDISGDREPGTVVVIDARNAGKLRASTAAYDQSVAGVISGAGGIKPGLHLEQQGTLEGSTPVAMSGRVYVKCSTENGAIHPGDRLTTADLPGHAMRATDRDREQGAVFGKAMTTLEHGNGLVLVLVNLQ